MSRINEGQAASQAKRGSRRWRKITAWSLAAVAVVLIGLAVALKTLTYEPLEQAEAAMKSDNKVTVSKLVMVIDSSRPKRRRWSRMLFFIPAAW